MGGGAGGPRDQSRARHGVFRQEFVPKAGNLWCGLCPPERGMQKSGTAGETRTAPMLQLMQNAGQEAGSCQHQNRLGPIAMKLGQSRYGRMVSG